MTTANQITIARILLIPLFVYFLLAQSLTGSNVIAAALFLALCLSDALDGFLARKLNQVSELGKLLDPLADKILVLGALLVFVELGRLPSWVVLIVVSRDFLVMGIRVWAAKEGRIIAASPAGKWKTALQMAAVFFLILNWPIGYLFFWISFLLCLASGWDYFKGFFGQVSAGEQAGNK
ncbi:MAG: CDP-diacylglycerol--glycerol-3-phosphate 3-phosphatidyltransferase [Candidatus Margulisiibacteriota bacterium]